MAVMDRRDHGHIVVLFRVRTNSDSVRVVCIVLLPLYPADTEKHGTGERHTNGRSSPGRRASGNVHFRTRKINSCDDLPAPSRICNVNNEEMLYCYKIHYCY